MIELNLLPDVKKDFIQAQRSRTLVVSGSILVMIASAAIVVLLLLYVQGAQRGFNFLVDKSIDDNFKQLSDSSKNEDAKDLDKYLTIQNQLAILPDLHGAKPLYSRLFTYLPTLNPAPPNNITINKISLSGAEATITIEGYGANYAAVNVFKSTLEKAELQYKEAGNSEQQNEQLFSSVNFSETNIADVNDRKVTTFKVGIAFSEVAFRPNLTEVKISVPSLNTTDSVQQSPKVTEVFGDKPSTPEDE